MAWNGSGTFARVSGSTTWADDRDASIEIEAGLHDTNDEDLATGINACLAKNGENAATSDLDLGSNKLTNVTDCTAAQDAATKNYVDTGRQANYATVATTTILTSEASEDTLQITIPAAWNGYDVELIATGYVAESTASTTATTCTIRTRSGTTGVGGTIVGSTAVIVDGTNALGGTRPFAVFGFLQGETTTGAIDYSLTSEASAESGKYSMYATRWKVTAFRTS